MFHNIGNKIKMVAQVFTWIGIVASILGGCCIMISSVELILLGVLVMVLGSLFSWLASLTLYGLGQLIENSDILVEQGETLVEQTSKNVQRHNANADSATKKTIQKLTPENATGNGTVSYIEVSCPNCKKEFSVPQGNTTATCPYCGATLKLSYS